MESGSPQQQSAAFLPASPPGGAHSVSTSVGTPVHAQRSTETALDSESTCRAAVRESGEGAPDTDHLRPGHCWMPRPWERGKPTLASTSLRRRAVGAGSCSVCVWLRCSPPGQGCCHKHARATVETSFTRGCRALKALLAASVQHRRGSPLRRHRHRHRHHLHLSSCSCVCMAVSSSS